MRAVCFWLNRLAQTDYDSAGYQKQLSATYGGTNATYDGEGRLAQVAFGAVVATYDYDAEGRRVKRTDGDGAATYYVYDAEGQLMAEYGGEATGSGTQYIATDHSGSTRMVQDAQGDCTGRMDYAPYGAVVSRSGQDCYATPWTSGQMFTGALRDGDTELDHMGARGYWVTLERFTSPDEPLVDQDPVDPQSWNLYSYVRNNPLIFTDPTGNGCVYLKSNGNELGSIKDEIIAGLCGETGGYWVDGTVTQARFAYGGLILTGTTNGENRTSASYPLGPDPGLMALKRAGELAEPGVNIAGAGLSLFMGGALTGMAVGTWAGGTALTTLTIPAATLPPLVSNPTLQAIVNKLFQVTDKLSGGTAGAVRYERLAGDLMSPSGHSGKAQEVIVALTNLPKSGKLTFNDQKVCREIIQELGYALKTQPRRQAYRYAVQLVCGVAPRGLPGDSATAREAPAGHRT